MLARTSWHTGDVKEAAGASSREPAAPPLILDNRQLMVRIITEVTMEEMGRCRL
jgi:hypothetical protein